MDSIFSDMESFFGKKSDDDVLRMREPGAVEKFYEKLSATYNMTELKDILDCDDNMLIVACAGAGKTTTLLLKIIKDILSGKLTREVVVNGQKFIQVKRILVSTFLKTGAEDLAKKFDELCVKYKVENVSSKNVSFRTIHSEVYAALQAMGVTINIAESDELSRYLAEACRYYKVSSIMGNGKALTKEELGDIECIVAYYRNRLDNNKFNHPLMKEYNLNEMLLEAVVERYNQLKALNRVQDFEDLEDMLYKAYPTLPNVLNFIKSRYDYVFVDEFQDTSQLQYGILEPYFKSAEGFIAIGDDDQCIVEGSKIKTEKGIKNIEDVVVGDKVLSGIGHSKTAYKEVENVSKKQINDSIYKVTTKSGKVLKATGEHIAFARLVPLDDVYYVYLMYREDIGFRIGRTSGVRAGARQKKRNGIEIRCIQEKAEKIWIIDSFDNLKESIYYENYYSYLYGIPQYVFEDSTGKDLQSLDLDKIKELHKNLNTMEKGYKLLSDIDCSFDKPHFVPYAHGNRVTLTHSIFGSSQYHKTNDVFCSELSATTCNEKYLSVLNKYLHICKKKITGSELFTNNARSTTSDIIKQHNIVVNIQKEICDTDVKLNVIEQAKLTDLLYTMMPFSNLRKGMYIPVESDGKLVDDVIVDITKEDYNGFVYDLSVPETVNFIVNDICVHNCIYGWRGSDIEIITKRFTTDYNPTIKHLTVNRRCPQEILNAVIPSIENNSNRHPKKLQASKTDGKIDIVVDGGIKYLSESIKEDLSKSERVGILGRTNADLLIPAMVLLLNNYTSFSVSKSVNLQSRIPSQVIGVMDLITQRYNNNFEGYFKLFTSKANAYQASKLCDVLSTSPDVSIYNLPMEDLEYSVPALFPLIRMLREEKEKDPVNAYITLLEVMEQEVYNGKTIYAQRARDFVYYIRKMIQEDNILKNKTIDELNMIFTSEIPKKLDERVIKRQKQEVDGKVKYYTPEDNSYVRITTVHDAKGKEWDNVYIWNDVDGCFPNSVGNRELSEEEFEEERRVHYIAWTRPKKKLTVFTRSDREPGFLGECDLTNAKVIKKNELLLTSLHTDKPPEKKSNGSKDITWVDYFKNYVIKFTSYDKICTVQGTNLDICMTKLGGSNGVISYLKDFQLEKYPINDLESVISDLLEQKALSYA